MIDTSRRPPLPLVLLLATCAGKEADSDVELDSTPADAVEPSCLIADPASLDLSGTARTGYVTLSGCATGASCSCSSPWSCTTSAAVSGSWIIAIDPATSTAVDGIAECTSSEGAAEVALHYTP